MRWCQFDLSADLTAFRTCRTYDVHWSASCTSITLRAYGVKLSKWQPLSAYCSRSARPLLGLIQILYRDPSRPCKLMYERHQLIMWLQDRIFVWMSAVTLLGDALYRSHNCIDGGLVMNLFGFSSRVLVTIMHLPQHLCECVERPVVYQHST